MKDAVCVLVVLEETLVQVPQLTFSLCLCYNMEGFYRQQHHFLQPGLKIKNKKRKHMDFLIETKQKDSQIEHFLTNIFLLPITSIALNFKFINLYSHMLIILDQFHVGKTLGCSTLGSNA